MIVVRVESPYGDHFACHAENAPTDAEEDRTYYQMVRIRQWDRFANARAATRICEPNA